MLLIEMRLVHHSFYHLHSPNVKGAIDERISSFKDYLFTEYGKFDAVLMN